MSRLTILRRHVLHNALPPVIPRLGLQFSTMLTLAMITEMVSVGLALGAGSSTQSANKIMRQFQPG
jgi:cationic peptide transport system permease protein